MLTVYIGYDSREDIAYQVCKYSILKHATSPVEIVPLRLDILRLSGKFKRGFYVTPQGTFWDDISEAPASTEFAISRFFSILLHNTHGKSKDYGIFMDCDMVLTDDIYEIYQDLDSRYAVQCVKHDHVPRETTKMDGQIQTSYPCKNWSSFFAFNPNHEAHRRLTEEKINTLPGRDLHRFCWLKDVEIGELPSGWNWLVNVQEKPEVLYNAHFTLGGPWFPGWERKEHDDLWIEYLREYEDRHQLGHSKQN